MADGVAITAGSGTTVATDDAGAAGHVQVIKLAISSDGSATLLPATAANGLLADVSRVQGTVTTSEGGTFGYAAGTAAATVDVPAGARARRVSVLAGSGGSATVTIAGGNTITVPASGSFDEQIPGLATLGGDVVIGGTVASYYVSWTA